MAVILGAQGYGETTVSAIKLGSTTIAKIYLGDDVVYDTSSSGEGSSGGGSSSYAISLWSDGSSTYQEYAEIQLGTLPSGGNGYKVEMTGTDNNSYSFTGVVVAVLTPTNNTKYYPNTQSNLTNNPSDDGPQNKNMAVSFNTATASMVTYMKVYAHNDNGATNVTVKVTAINSSYASVSSVSNTLTGIEIDVDG